MISKEDKILLESLVEKYGAEGVLNELNIPKKLLPAIVAGGISLAGIGAIGATDHLSHRDKNDIEIENVEGEEDSASNPYNMSDQDYLLFLDKTEAAKNEIDRILSYKGLSSDDIDFHIDTLVYDCYKHDFDLPLALAQLRCESHFGTTPRAKRTNSIFSIGAYDSGKNGSRYETQDDSIEPYIIIMKRDFMQDGKRSVDDILKHGEMYRLFGTRKARYASDPNYEDKIRSVRREMIKRSPVLSQNYSTSNII